MANPNTAVFPSAAAADADLLVAKNNAASTLTASMTNVATSFTVANGAVFGTPCLVTIGSEIILVGSFSGNVGTVTSRHFGGTSAAAHSSGDDVISYVDEYHLNQLAAEVMAIESGLGANFVNVKGMNTGTVFCHVVLASANAAVSNGGLTMIPFDTDITNTGAAHSTSVNPSRMTVPAGKDGLYSVSGSIRWASTTAGGSNFTAVAIYKNGVQMKVEAAPAAGTATSIQSVSMVLPLVASDYVEIAATQVTGVSVDVVANNPQTQAQFVKLT